MATTPKFVRLMSCANAFWITVRMAIALLVAGAAGPASAIALREGFNESTLAANDDGSTGLVDIGFNVNFYGTTYSQLFVNNNGNVTFNAPLPTFTPFALTSPGNPPIIAAFFADVDTRGEGGALTAYGVGVVDGRAAFGVTWNGVGYYSNHTDKLNQFQLVLVDRSDTGTGNFDIEFRYAQIQWETGDASSGSGGLGGSSARVGYTAGTAAPGTFAELTGSGVNGAFLDGGSNALVSNSNVGEGGRYLFQVRGGIVTPTDFPSVAFGDWVEDVEVDVDFTPQETEVRTAYLAVQEEGVEILDVSDPDAMASLGSYDPGTCPNGASMATFFADDVTFVKPLSALFVAAGRCGVIVLDVSDPAAPVVLERYDTPVWAEAVEVEASEGGVIGYIADHNGGLVIVDFSNLFDGTPSPPVLRGSIGSSTTGWGTGAAIDVALFDNGDALLAFVAATQGLRVVNVSNAASPQLIGFYDTSPNGSPPEVPQDITLSEDGNTALIAGWQAGLLAIDVSNPSAPTLRNRISTTPGNAYYESEIDGNFVFATEGKVGLRTFALSADGLQPIEGEEPIPIARGDGWAWDVQTADSVAYVTYGILEGADPLPGTGGLTVIELEPSGIVVDFGGDPGKDGDGDGTPDADDNCSDVANAGQVDADQDGFGNACDADYNDDGAVGGADFSILRAAFGSQTGEPRWNAEVDHDGNGAIAAADFSVFRARLGGAPGPSGLSCAGSAPCPSP